MKTVLIRTVVFIGFVCVIAVLLINTDRSRSPVYHGKHLTFWLQEAAATQGTKHTEAVTAIRAIGTNAIPDLLAMLTAKDSRAVALARKWHCHHLLQLKTANDYHVLALTGFLVLGHAANAAEPELVKLSEYADPEIRRAAVICLYDVRGGPDMF